MASFAFFQNAVQLAHSYWQRLIQKGDTVIDATCGNGRDTLALAQLTLTSESGKVIAMDLQAAAIAKAQELLRRELSEELYARIEWIHGCHSQWPSKLFHPPPRLIVYNLGYLPGGNKSLTTQTKTTWSSVEQAMSPLLPGGCLSITCYPGHPEGLAEERHLKEKLAVLDPAEWSVCHHRWINRRQAPSLFIIEKGTLR